MVIILDEKTLQQKIDELYKMNVYNGIVNKEYYLCSSFRKEDKTSVAINNEILSVIKYVKDKLIVNISMIRLISVLAKLGLARLYVYMKNSGLIDIYKDINKFAFKADRRLHLILFDMISINISVVMRGRKSAVSIYIDDIMTEMIDDLSRCFGSISELISVALLFSLYDMRSISDLMLDGAIDDVIIYKVIIDEQFRFVSNLFNKFEKMGLTVRGDK